MPVKIQRGGLYDKLRREVFTGTKYICVREELSAEMIKNKIPEANVIVTMDSAFQHPVNIKENSKLFNDDAELKNFIGDGSNIIGVTPTHLYWNNFFNENKNFVADNVRVTFSKFMSDLVSKGYKILFIPQLFGNQNDFGYMSSFSALLPKNSSMILNNDYDCYFQQFIISKIKAVVGMRYHSNIFSAKMNTPFISIAYEYKMTGFMKKAGLMNYCIDINNLNYENLTAKFNYLIQNYDEYKNNLISKHGFFIKESSRTMDLLCEVIDDSQK